MEGLSVYRSDYDGELTTVGRESEQSSSTCDGHRAIVSIAELCVLDAHLETFNSAHCVLCVVTGRCLGG